jgi:Domain of unknown function (DUF4129)
MTQVTAGVLALLATVIYGSTAIWLAPYRAPWSAPWHVGAMSRLSAAGNAALRLLVPSALIVASTLPYATGAPAHVPPPPSPQVVPFHSGSLGLTWELLILGVAGIAVLGSLAYFLARAVRERSSRDRKLDAVAVVADATSLRDLADQALLELLRQKDPRRAILACYALMESGLATRGLPRRPEETAIEYARRLLAGAGAPPAPLRSLTGLFQLAGFSTHAMDETMRQTAISSLRAFGETAQ